MPRAVFVFLLFCLSEFLGVGCETPLSFVVRKVGVWGVKYPTIILLRLTERNPASENLQPPSRARENLYDREERFRGRRLYEGSSVCRMRREGAGE
jgi:hypothetical protein